jgi:type VI secretion system protein ImpG
MKDLLRYYQDELLFLRKKGGSFSRLYPEIAASIDIKDGQSTDPHTERIIEAVAFMAARLHQRIDDNDEYLAFHILNAICPNLVNFFPPCSIVSFTAKSGEQPDHSLHIPRRTKLSFTGKNGSIYYFSTLNPIDVYPITITGVFLERATLKIDFMSKTVPIEKMEISKILLHINSNIIDDAMIIYEALFANRGNVLLKTDNRTMTIQMNAVGFGDDDTACPVSKYSSNVFQLFQELLHFRQKFMFFELSELDFSSEKDVLEFSILIPVTVSQSRLLQIIKNNSFLLNCVPVANLFPFTSDPFRFTGERNKYLLLADQLHDTDMEIHSITNVHSIDSQTSEDRIIQPYFSLSIDSDTNILHQLFWLHTKESSEIRGLPGHDIYLSLVDTNLNYHRVYDDVVYAKLMCSNRLSARDVPVLSKLDVNNLETGGIFGKLIYKMTSPVDVPNNLWALVSELASLQMPLSKNIIGSLKQIIKLLSGDNIVKANELLGQISSVSVFETVKRIGKDAWRGFAKGIEFDLYTKQQEQTHIAFLLSCFINEYISSCVSLNSFVHLKLFSEKTNAKIAEWLPTSGRKSLI